MILLAFRAAKHYWQLAIRQLMLPSGMRGESFPYRADFVYRNLAGTRFPRGLICGKLDVSDFLAGDAPLYIPFRFITQVELKTVPTGTINYFDYVLGPTVDYRGRHWTAYSAGLYEAVRAAMARQGDQDHQDTDSNLVIEIGYDYPHLPEREELDRWVTLTRLLAQPEPYAHLNRREDIWRQYRQVVYSRVVSISEEGKSGTTDPQANYWEGRAVLPAGRECALNLVTNLAPDVAFLSSRYRLEVSADLFSVIDDTSEIFKGITNHRFLFRTRKIVSARSHLRIRAEEPDLYVPEVVLPVSFAPSAALALRFLGALLVVLGLFGAFLGVVPDDSLRHFQEWFPIPDVSLDSFRFGIRFAALTMTTSGIGISLLQRA